jgi:hypothetical protein
MCRAYEDVRYLCDKYAGVTGGSAEYGMVKDEGVVGRGETGTQLAARL